MRLILAPERKQRIDRIFEVVIIVAALATMPLTYAHMQEMDGPWLFAADWVVWAVFAAEYTFAMAVSADRWRTTKRQWLNASIVVLSFPLLPHLLGLTRLVRLIRPLRVIGGLRIGRPLVLARLWVVRSAGSRQAMRKAKETPQGQKAAAKADEARERAKERVPGVGDES